MSQAASLEAIQRRRRIVLIGSVAILFVSSGGMYLIVVALKEVALEFGWPRAVPSLAFSLQFVGSGFGGIIMGHVLDRLGFGAPAVIGAVMVGTGAMLVSTIDSAWQLHVIYGVMFGLAGQGSLSAPALANIARWYDRRRGTAVGVVASGQALAGIVWPPVFGNVMEAVGWRAMFLWFGVFALVVMLPVCWLVRYKPPAALPADGGSEPRAAAGRARSRARRRAAPLSPRAVQLILCTAIIGCCTAMALPLGHLVAYVTDLGHPITSGVQVLAVALLAAFLCRLMVLGPLADRLGGLRALLVFSGLQAAMLAALTVVHDLTGLYVVAALYGLGYGGVFPSYAVAVRDHLPIMEVGRRTGVVFLFGAAAMGFGSWMGGVLYDATGAYTLAFAIGVGFNLANLVIIALLIARLRAAPAPAAAG